MQLCCCAMSPWPSFAAVHLSMFIHPLCTSMAWHRHLWQGCRQARGSRAAIERLDCSRRAGMLPPFGPRLLQRGRWSAGQAAQTAGARRCAQPARGADTGPGAIPGRGRQPSGAGGAAQARQPWAAQDKTTTQATAGVGATPVRAAEGGLRLGTAAQ